VQTYCTLTGRTLDLSELSDEERAFFERCVDEYKAGTRWADFVNLVSGNENPLVRGAGGLITRAVHDHPLLRALSDLEHRLGLAQGKVAPEDGLYPESDPLADEWIPVSEAARRKAVTVSAVHQAIGRGALIAHPAKPGGSWLLVSAASLDAWTPNPRRQAAGRRLARAG
jgi:hypothetical protein